MNQSGQGTLDFLYASILILGTATLIGSLTMALTLTEIVQYVSFSAARSYLAAAKTPSDQAAAGNAKADALLKALPFLTAATSNGWLNVTRGGAKDYTDYAQSQNVTLRDPERNEFTGYQMQVTLPLLKIKIPLLGNVIKTDDQDVSLTISSFLMREPSWDECTKFNNQVFQALMNKNGAYRNAQGANFTAVNDNGC